MKWPSMRAYDPCISCSTHLDDSLVIELKDDDGKLVKSIRGGKSEQNV